MLWNLASSRPIRRNGFKYGCQTQWICNAWTTKSHVLIWEYVPYMQVNHPMPDCPHSSLLTPSVPLMAHPRFWIRLLFNQFFPLRFRATAASKKKTIKPWRAEGRECKRSHKWQGHMARFIKMFYPMILVGFLGLPSSPFSRETRYIIPWKINPSAAPNDV